MRGHWVSQTRKLNHHYQSAGRVTPAPLAPDVSFYGGVSFGYSNSSYINISNTNQELSLHWGGMNAGATIARFAGSNIIPLYVIPVNMWSVNNRPLDLNGAVSNSNNYPIKHKIDTIAYTDEANGVSVYEPSHIFYIEFADFPIAANPSMFSRLSATDIIIDSYKGIHEGDIIQYQGANIMSDGNLNKHVLGMQVKRPITSSAFGDVESGSGVTFTPSYSDENHVSREAYGKFTGNPRVLVRNNTLWFENMGSKILEPNSAEFKNKYLGTFHNDRAFISGSDFTYTQANSEANYQRTWYDYVIEGSSGTYSQITVQ